MTQAEELFHEIAAGIPDAKEGKMFGALCFKAPNGKAAAMFCKEYMVFKIEGGDQDEALALKDAKIFEPSPGKKMGGWVQLSYDHAKKWPALSKKAMDKLRLIKAK